MPSARDAAEALALSALGWIAEDPERIGAFLGQSGLDPDVLRARAADPDLLAAVLDFVLSEDAHVLGFAANAGLRPEAVVAARAHLPGGADPHWT